MKAATRSHSGYNGCVDEHGDKVVVAMSGGVDSSVAACLLAEQGYDVLGLFMRVGVPEVDEPCSTDETPSIRVRQGCCSARDAADARFVAGMMKIPFYVLDFHQDFNRIIDYFADEYARARTPNPCIVCNDQLKFGKIVEYADAVGARYVATGHYARIVDRGGRPAIARGLDGDKDQSYVLFGLDRAVLDRVLFPIGELSKPEVRALAKRFGLPNRDKPDSVEICFVPDQNYARLVRERRPDAIRPGNIVDEEGKVVGRHEGLVHYTIGQRRGLGISRPKPTYVTHLDPSTDTVTIGERSALLRSTLSASRLNLLADPPAEKFGATAQIRYLHRGGAAQVELLSQNRVRVVFDEPQSAITPGQAVVIYDDDVLIGGAWID